MNVDFGLRQATGMQYLLDQMHPCTPFGSARVRTPHFFAPQEKQALLSAWHNVQAAVDGLGQAPAIYQQISHVMMQMRDIRGSLQACKASILTEIELFEIKRFLLQCAQLMPLYAQVQSAYHDITLTDQTPALDLLDPQHGRQAGFSLSIGFSQPLTEICEAKRMVEKKLRGADDAQRTALMEERRALVVREEAEMLQVRKRLTAELKPFAEAILQNIEAVGQLDYTLQKAALAQAHGMVRPEMAKGTLRFEAMQNPQIAGALHARGETFTSISLDLPIGATVITGANMGGKSVALKTLVLNVLLCQAGFFACAGAAALPLFDEVFCLWEDAADAKGGLSSFGAEIIGIQRALERVQAGAFCLIAMDEPARGTNPHEGAALVRALVNRLSGMRAITALATHYDAVGQSAQGHYQAAGLKDVDLQAALPQDRLAYIAAHMNYGLKKVDASAKAPQEALAICCLLGLDEAIVQDMVQILNENTATKQDMS